MNVVLLLLASVILISCGSYKGNEIWRRSTCEEIVDSEEREQCLEDATRPESEWKQDLEEAKGE